MIQVLHHHVHSLESYHGSEEEDDLNTKRDNSQVH